MFQWNLQYMYMNLPLYQTKSKQRFTNINNIYFYAGFMK